MIFALVTETRFISQADLYAMVEPLRVYMGHVAKAYMEEFPASVVVVDRSSRVPQGAMPIVLVDKGVDPQTIAHHYYDPIRDVPAARVFVENTTGINDGHASIFESICHEMAEAKINPYVAVWFDHPNPARRGVQVAHENCDPTQDTYVIEHKGTRWQACNFVTPHWWRRELFGRPAMVRELERVYGYGVDWCRRLSAPGDIGPSGYAVMRRARADGSWETWSEDALGILDAGSRKLAGKKDELSRTRRLGGVS